MMKNCLILLFIFQFSLIFSQKYTLSGTITDKKTGEELIGATVFVKNLKTGTTSNDYGFYSLSLPKGNYTLVFSYLGYQDYLIDIEFDKSRKANVELEETSKQLGEITVTGEKKDQNVRKVEMSVTQIPIKTIQKLPSLMGETDILKTIQMLPGVQTSGEGSTGFYVRGGSVDQNLILLDEATVYNASHLAGIFSVFNNDAIKDITLYKGGIPAEYGGRLSSLLDIRMKEGNSKKFTGTGGIGILSSRLTLESPIIQDKCSGMISGRRTYADLFFPLFKGEMIKESKAYFYDLNLKTNYKINSNNRIFISGYFGRDIAKFGELFDMFYGNATLSARYNTVFTDKLFSNFSFIYSNFNYGLGTSMSSAAFLWSSAIIDYSFKNDYNWYVSPKINVKFGFISTYHTFKPGKIEKKSAESIVNNLTVPDNFAFEHGVFASTDYEITEKLSIQAGLRFSAFQNFGKSTYYVFDKSDPEEYRVTDTLTYNSNKIIKTHAGLEPRIAVRFQINSSTSIKANYNRTMQYIQLASNSTSVTPLDMWFPASPNIKPQMADQFALGIFKNLFDNLLETSVETYAKKMHNSIDFRDHAMLLINPYFEGEVRTGNAYSYGLELFVRKNTGKITGWISYTFANSYKIIEEINNGKKYLAPYDKPHNISVVLSYDISERINFSANWIYSTGAPRTMPTGRFEYQNMIAPVYSDRNSVRLPDYHRLDVSLTLYGKKFKKNGQPKKYSGNWNFSVYNVYNRHNAYSINFIQSEFDPNVMQAEKLYLFKVFPSVTYNFNF